MSEQEKLSKEEFVAMLKALKRHAETDMDQWAEWKLDSSRGKIFIKVAVAPDAPEECYIDVNHLLK
ncbi:MAG: hypothetical protein HWE27_16885 [Gammaproteobacteria bacterium]|nr:hypothetical protein [Gammaproteobacteria bacterium]